MGERMGDPGAVELGDAELDAVAAGGRGSGPEPANVAVKQYGTLFSQAHLWHVLHHQEKLARHYHHS
ncbi:hypothetical protein [Kitasatospora sp. NPDC093102]|uniref:hypothetical protein n=1 Tax=Kitasatospora sp. NPDC093102 TaxID=3155069 RepID=UPI0034404D16